MREQRYGAPDHLPTDRYRRVRWLPTLSQPMGKTAESPGRGEDGDEPEEAKTWGR